MHQAAWGDCAADYTEYAVDGALDATEPTDSGDLGLHCVNGRLEIRSELLPQLPLGALGATALPQ